MERFMQLATTNLDIRYECAKCSADLQLVNPLGLRKNYLNFERIDERYILETPAISLRNLCGMLGRRMLLSCQNCQARIGYQVKGQYRINIESINLALREVAVKAELIEPDPDALQADSAGDGEAQSAPELHYEDSQAEVEADLEHENEAEAEPKPISEAFKSALKGEQIDMPQPKVEPSISEA